MNVTGLSSVPKTSNFPRIWIPSDILVWKVTPFCTVRVASEVIPTVVVIGIGVEVDGIVRSSFMIPFAKER